ncbi:chorismate mutase [uncultured Algimonas sp.]|uniref:chorismate mutase n=1 Tax=uncultured Algimonas sp. TaxID=1547920 RepID=UPI00262BE98D|nr:chorismate mutase [uncultured Algimonas sp.]
MNGNSDLERVRRDIDRVDRAMLDLIAERLALSADVRRAKAGSRLWRPAREDGHVADLARMAQDTGTPPALISRIWAELMSASISVQGSTRIHVALEGDGRANLSLIRDRFGGSLPLLSYPTSSNALAAAYGEDEGIAVLPAPGGMTRWWTALAPGGAMPEMKIVAPLPRVDADDWPQAVAVAAIGLDMPVAKGGRILCAVRGDMTGTLRAESADLRLYEVAEAETVDMEDVIGYLPPPVSA